LFDLTFQTERERLSATIAADVEAESVEAFREAEPRWHLGASVIGGECLREAWYAFRWFKQEEKNGRQYRLLNRGHLEEPRFIERLRGIGFEVFEFDAEGKQYRVSGHKGHYGGSLDTVAIPPVRYELPINAMLVEYKTHSEKSFTKLAGKQIGKHPLLKRDPASRQGLKLSKPQHYSQMCSYGQAYQLKYGLYCAVNKNTDELYFEIVELDWTHGVNLYERAGRVIFSQTPPPKVSQSPAYFYCKTLCPVYMQCHYGGKPDANCRSCEHAFPVEDGGWYCRVHDRNLTRPEVIAGCPQWRAIA
jgi:hypothetical protein